MGLPTVPETDCVDGDSEGKAKDALIRQFEVITGVMKLTVKAPPQVVVDADASP